MWSSSTTTWLKGKKTITIPRTSCHPRRSKKHLIFFKLYNGQLDPYRGEAVPADSKLPKYLQGRDRGRGKDGRPAAYFFDYLEDKDWSSAATPTTSSRYADYKEVREAAQEAPGRDHPQVAQGPEHPGSRFGLYGLCSATAASRPTPRPSARCSTTRNAPSPAGSTACWPGTSCSTRRPGWDYLVELIKDTKEDFPIRYAGLRTVRFFWEFRRTYPHKQVLEAMKTLMDQPDIADLPIEDLRKWKVWELTPWSSGYATRRRTTRSRSSTGRS